MPHIERIQASRSGHIVVGVDTHKDQHVAVVLDTTAGRQASRSVTTDTHGFEQLVQWAESYGQIVIFGVEGTGSYGATLASFIRRHGYHVVEVNRPDRRLRRLNGKSDTLDAENAARAVLAGMATAEPKTADGTVEMIRQLKIARDTAVKSRTAAIIALKNVLIHAPEALRKRWVGQSPLKLARDLARLRPGQMTSPDDSIRYTLRSLARRWQYLDIETRELTERIDRLVRETAPQLIEPLGIGVDTAAEILIVVGDNPGRIASGAALAKLAGVSPIPASSGRTTGKHRLNRGGHRQLNAAIYRTVIVRMRFHEPTRVYVARRTAEGKSKRDIIRCLKRYVIREVYHLLKAGPARSIGPA